MLRSNNFKPNDIIITNDCYESHVKELGLETIKTPLVGLVLEGNEKSNSLVKILVQNDVNLVHKITEIKPLHIIKIDKRNINNFDDEIRSLIERIIIPGDLVQPIEEYELYGKKFVGVVSNIRLESYGLTSVICDVTLESGEKITLAFSWLEKVKQEKKKDGFCKIKDIFKRKSH
jgi:hypothetical protein